jgi:hypothetical protein
MKKMQNMLDPDTKKEMYTSETMAVAAYRIALYSNLAVSWQLQMWWQTTTDVIADNSRVLVYSTI